MSLWQRVVGARFFKVTSWPGDSPLLPTLAGFVQQCVGVAVPGVWL